ncbi:MAG: hypothetical protein KGI84_03410, partial [Elusimicrobia bacterium]|nr:hypothetical protein [Elusimicrobiota bacterium]
MNGSKDDFPVFVRKAFSILISFLILGVGPQLEGYRLAAQEFSAEEGAPQDLPATGLSAPAATSIPNLPELPTDLSPDTNLSALPDTIPADSFHSKTPRTAAPASKASVEPEAAARPAQPQAEPSAESLPSPHTARTHTGEASSGSSAQSPRPFAYLQHLKEAMSRRLLDDSRGSSASAEKLSRDAQFDSATPEASSPAQTDSALERAGLLRAVLSAGTKTAQGQRIHPFVFHVENQPDEMFSARNAGLEGFTYSKREIESDLGPAAILHHLDQYFDYL